MTITSWSNGPQPPCKTQHQYLLLLNSLTHALSVSFPPLSGSEDGEPQPPLAKQPRVHADADLNQNVSVFLSLIFCPSKRATLPPVSAAPSSVAYLSATIITSFYSSSSRKRSSWICETLNGRGIMGAGFARKLSWGLFAVQQNYSHNMATDAPSVIPSCSACDSLSHAALRYLPPQNCTCEHSPKRCSNTLTQT